MSAQMMSVSKDRTNRARIVAIEALTRLRFTLLPSTSTTSSDCYKANEDLVHGDYKHVDGHYHDDDFYNGCEQSAETGRE